MNENCRVDVFIIQSTSFPANDNLMELLILIDIKRAPAKRITALFLILVMLDKTENLAQERHHAKLVQIYCNLEQSVKYGFACRSNQGFFDIPTDNLIAAPILLSDIKIR